MALQHFFRLKRHPAMEELWLVEAKQEELAAPPIPPRAMTKSAAFAATRQPYAQDISNRRLDTFKFRASLGRDEDYIQMIFTDYVELHGDRAIGDDRAIRTGFAVIGDYKVVLIGHQKHISRERNECLYGCAIRKDTARRWLHELAANIGCRYLFIDTSGAYPGIGAPKSEPTHSSRRAFEMSRIARRSSVSGHRRRGLGGALGIGIGDRVAMLRIRVLFGHQPRRLCGILWKEANDQTKRLRADALKLTRRFVRLGVIDHIIPNRWGAHRDPAPWA